MRQFYLAPDLWPDTLDKGVEVLLPADESRHLLRVLRTKPGDAVRLTDGDGRLLGTELMGDRSGRATLMIQDVRNDIQELATPHLVLACGMIKGKRWEWLLEKATEIGVHRIVPLHSDHAEIDPGQGKQRRWELLLLSALKQSGRSWRPRLETPVSVVDFLDGDSRRTLCYGLARIRDEQVDRDAFLSTHDLSDPSIMANRPVANSGDLVWCVGPEGGWSTDEVALLSKAGRAVRLGGTRLRTETAAIVGLHGLAAARESIIGELPIGNED